MSDLLGPYAKPRQWLVNYLRDTRFKNELLWSSLQEDWSVYNREKAAYLLGTIWGRLRQMDQALEYCAEYAELMKAELEDDK